MPLKHKNTKNYTRNNLVGFRDLVLSWQKKGTDITFIEKVKNGIVEAKKWKNNRIQQSS